MRQGTGWFESAPAGSSRKLQSMSSLPAKEPPRGPQHGVLRGLWASWKRIGRKIGNFQARVLMTIFYFTLFLPFALIVRWNSDPLAIKQNAPHGWQVLGPPEGSPLDRSRSQF